VAVRQRPSCEEIQFSCRLISIPFFFVLSHSSFVTNPSPPRFGFTPSPPPPPFLSFSMKFVMLIAFLVAAIALLCIRVPSVWFAFMAIDKSSDVRELGLVVASRMSSLYLHSPTVCQLSFPPHIIKVTLSAKVVLQHAWPSLS
jgi:hypothetical protein